MSKYLVLFLGLFISFSLFCDSSVTEQKEISIAKNVSISDCGGFEPNDNLSKRMVDTSDYCKAEKVIWQYTEDNKTLRIEIKRIIANCAAEYSLTATMENDTLVITLEDTCKNVDANCMCPFDASCEIKDITGTNLNIQYKKKGFNIALNEIGGEFIVDTSLTMCP